jgi:hypothetical protein
MVNSKQTADEWSPGWSEVQLVFAFELEHLLARYRARVRRLSQRIDRFVAAEERRYARLDEIGQ